jgi:hypothetical protein
MNDRRFQRISTIVCLVTSLTAPAAFTAGQEPLRSLPTLTVIDGHGQRVGTVTSLLILNPAIPILIGLVAFAVGDQPFILRVGSQGIGSGNGMPLFNSGNCSGTPLVFESIVTNSLIEPAVVSAPGHTVYLSEPGAMPQVFTSFVGTQLRSDGTCLPANLGNISLLPARAVVDLDTLFTPPFSVR